MFSAVRAGTLVATQLTLSLNQAVTLCVSIYESLAFKTTNFFLLASMRESDFLFAVNALLDCETYVSAQSRTPHYCKASSCNPPQLSGCHKPLKFGKHYVGFSHQPVRSQEMHSFQVDLIRNLVYTYAGCLPDNNHPISAPDAICYLGPNIASCGSCSRSPP
ncbi:hypothetical protein O181_084222 [Austropuccinia psidii MF-1]|uniref:Uncharacterized protein n=1 Tax=Austropuccinia psidii MF-1 TaxID=1389203 RepID=A0A9Q3FTT9_9BASI|nr:hypothetical protein [Austropuccinia psidii MF-1]